MSPPVAARSRLLIAASALFARRGYAATSVRQIVERAGVTKPVLYYHFGSKEGIYRALIERLHRDFEERLERRRDNRGGARERVIALCTDLFELVRQRAETVRFFYGVHYGAPQGAPFCQSDVFPHRFRQELVRTLRQGVINGELRPVRAGEIATAIHAILNEATDMVVMEPSRRFTRRDMVRLLELLFNGVAPHPGKETHR